MVTVLLHSSKTMHLGITTERPYQHPIFIDTARDIMQYLRNLDTIQLQSAMKLSPTVAERTRQTIHAWTDTLEQQIPAIDLFAGDIYSGLQAQTFTDTDRDYANEHLYILSGLYGVLKACDNIAPYRLEMGYHLPDGPYQNLYKFWNNKIAEQLPRDAPIINLTALEYSKAVLPHLPDTQIVTPKFLSVHPDTGEQKFVAVHAKIARGAFAHWIIENRIEDVNEITKFSELGYNYDQTLSKTNQPVFVCKKFLGLGLSVRS